MVSELKCPLCRSELKNSCFSDKKREFFRCNSCNLVSVPEKYHLSGADEKARYDLHENSPDMKGYIEFLNRFVSMLRNYIGSSSTGLDFGSGPVPVLAGILSSLQYDISIFDPFYAENRSVLEKKYDFITMVEVLEHLKDPEKELGILWKCLISGGVIGIKTGFVPEESDRFREWSYKNDLTHICFYSKRSFEWIAEHFKAELVFPGDNMVLMFKT